MSYRGGLDLEGRIVIKVRLGNDIRKMLIHNDDITYDELVLMMQRIYKNSVQQSDELTIKYKDEDGDEVTIFDSSDVSFAIQACNRQLKLVLYVNGLQRNFDDSEVATIKKGLQDVRDRVNGLLDEINAKTRANSRLDTSQDDDGVEEDTDPTVSSSAPPTQQIKSYSADNKEFDPLDSMSAAQQHDGGHGDKTASSQYGGSQYGGDQVSKSFDQMSMSDRQSVNQSPTPASLQSSFGSAFNPQQQQQLPVSTPQTTQQTTPASTGQYPNMYAQQQPAQNVTAGTQHSAYQGYNQQQTPAPTSQYSQPQQNGSMPPVSSQTGAPQATQQPQQTFNYQSWHQQNPAAQTPTSQPQQMPGQPGAPPQPMSQMPGVPQQAPFSGAYNPATQQPQQQQPQQQSMYGAQPQPGGGMYAGPGVPASPGNPYGSKPGQIRAYGAYPRATGSYPLIQQPGAQQGGFRPPAPQQ